MTPVETWLLTLQKRGFVVVDTTDTHYAHAESAVSVLRRRAKQHGVTFSAEVLSPTKAVVAL